MKFSTTSSVRSASLATLLVASISVAASMPSAASDVASAATAGFVWTGGYVGLQVGHAWGDSYYDDGFGSFINYDPKGVIGGAYAGYNHQFGNLVIGAEADLNFSGIERGRAPEEYEGGGSSDVHYGTAEMKWNGTIRARLGYAVDRFLPYVAAGVAFAKYDIALMHDDFSHFERSTAVPGWTLGGGIEYAATDNLMVRAEYRYTDYGNETWDDENWGDGLNVDLKTHDLRLGIAYKF
ncbi:outer membrane protein [Aminobacter sp. DSM 101952]|uniref:outer membrane protein n=1 Tax=Aminobacter sp. DSM 101952 TaxID=2735891 RepID=UPI00138F12B0|nr:outer membrane protein [Aminobacter sp. DSM 101952]